MRSEEHRADYTDAGGVMKLSATRARNGCAHDGATLGRWHQVDPGSRLWHRRAAIARRYNAPNSKVAGVQIGLNVPYNFGGRDMDPDELLNRCLKLNVSARRVAIAAGRKLSRLAGRQRKEGRRRRDAEVAHVGSHGIASGTFRKKYERRRRPHRDRQIRRHLHHGGRRGGLLLQRSRERSAREPFRAKSTRKHTSASGSSPTSTR